MDGQNKLKLSKAVLDMKFMKRTKERVEKEEEDAEGRMMYSNEITEDMLKEGKYMFEEVSMGICKDIVDGRMSFGGFNMEIEKLMAEEYAKRVEKVVKEKETDVSDLEMAKKLNPLVNSVGKKFQNKKDRGEKRKFMKPSDDI